MKLTSRMKSKLFSIFSHKILFCGILLIFSLCNLFCAEYVWTGGGDGSTWTDVANWGGSGYPGESDNARFSSGAEVTITSDITVNEIYLNAGSKVTCDSNVTISLNSIITQGEFLNKGTLQKQENVSFIIKVEAGGKLINENKIICTDIEGLGNSNITNNGTIEASGAATFQSGANFTNASELSIGGAMRNEGAFTNSGGTVTVKGTTTNSGTITNSGDFTSEGAITNTAGGTVTNSGGTITGTITNSGTVTNTGGTISGTVTGNEVVGGGATEPKSYSTKTSSNTLNWNDPATWENGEIPDISGNTAVEITLNANVESTTDLTFNNSGSKQIDLYLNGYTLDLSNAMFVVEHGQTHSEKFGNIHIYGSGKVIARTLDTSSNDEYETKTVTPHRIYLYDGAEFYVTESLYPNGSYVIIQDVTGDSKFYLTASGANVNYGGNGIEYIDIQVEPYGEPTIYKVIDMGGDPYVDGKTVQLFTTRENVNDYYVPIQFKYHVEIIGSSTWTFTVDGVETEFTATTPDFSNYVELPKENGVTKDILIKCTTPETVGSGEGLILTIKTPDGTMDLAEIRCLNSEILWTGNQDTNFSNPANWTIDGEVLDNIAELENQAVVIPSGCTNYPTLQSNISVKKLSIKTNANVTISSGVELTTEKLELSGTGKIIAGDGIINFTGSGDVDNPSYVSENPDLSSFGTIQVESGNFYLGSNLSVKQLNIQDGATVTIPETVELTVEKINILGTGSLDATAGKVIFAGTGTNENPSYYAENSLGSTFGMLEITSGATFVTKTDLHITKALTNNGTFQVGQSVTVKTIENNGTIDFAGSTVKTDSITNNDTIKLTGKEVLQIQDIKNGEESTVIYYGTNENAEFVWGGEYEKLIIESGFSGSCDRGIIIKKSLKFKNSSGDFDLVCENLGIPNVAELSGAIELKNLTDFAEIKFAGNGVFTGTIESSRNTKITSDYGRICFDSNIVANFNSPLTIQTNALDQGFVPAGTINLGSTCDVLCNLYLTNQVKLNIGGKLSVGNQTVQKDVFISAMEAGSPLDVEIAPKDATNQEFQVYGNFLLFNGKAKISTDLTVGKDMILLNGENPSMFNDPISGIEGLFAYNLSGRGDGGKTAAINFTNDFPTTLPKGTASGNNQEETLDSTKYVSTFDFATGKTILVWNNFYNNGVDLGTNTTGSWYLKFPANDVATSSFAECYNATIKNCNVFANTTPGEAWLATENCNDGTGNTNVAFSKAILANVATISDNIIRVRFVDGNSTLDEKPEIKIENSCNEISAWLENFRFNVSGKISEDNPGIQFTGVYANPGCTESTDGKGDLSTFYLKYEIPTDGSIDYRWNTDATGSDPGAEESTNTKGIHKNVVPNLAFKRAIEASYAGLRDEHKNRLVSVGTNTAGAEPLFEATKDEAPPVLVAVTLGQEQHETVADSQHHYDSHNFIEWQFSEPVEITYNSVSQGGFGTSTGTELVSNAENIQTTENFGKITNANNGFSVAGLGSFQNGKVTVGSKTGSGEVNAFYRNFALEAGKTTTAQEVRIRLSIAGYVDEGNSVTVNGVDYNNWLGFIDSKNTTIPSGTFTMEDSAFLSIKDKSVNKNSLVPAKNQPVTVNKVLSLMDEATKGKTLYGTWDIDPPVVANYMKGNSSNIYAQELIAVNNTSGEIAESLELHFLDNSVYNKYEGKENLQWRTKIGWIENNVHLPQNIPLDIRGGSRMVSTENQTYGGVRFSTLVDVLDSFVCKNLTTGENIVLNELSQSTTNEVIFGESDENQFDVPYLTLKFENAKGSLLKHNFELEYNKNSQKTGFITDLAGNLLYEFSVKSPDKNPPQFLLSIGGVNHDKLYILFSKPIDYLNQNQEPDEGKLRRIVKSLSIFESSSDGKKDTELISYKLGSQAKVVTETKESTGIEISLTRSVSYDELKNLYIGVNSFDSGIEDEDGDSSQGDPITGEMGKYSMLYDMFENPISEDSKHCFSDFAVNAFDVLYAYDGRAIEDAALNQGVFGGNQWTVTDFSGEINNSSKVIAGKDITIAGKIVDFSDNPDNQDKFSMLADISPSKSKAGLDFTDYSGINTRLWFSDFVKYFPVNNSITSNNYTTDNLFDNGKIETTISGKDNQSFTYVIPNEKEDSKSVNWVDGDEFEFLFKVLDSNNEVIMVDGNVDGDTDDEVDHPLFALRLKDENDMTSIDLWSLHVVELLRQKGGATILNNVINSLNNEETAIEIQVPQTGFLTVQVLTLDGNVVKVLQKGRVEEGTYYYKWNGTNNSGAAVARGMYFIRVVGPKIDETRKVMVIKE